MRQLLQACGLRFFMTGIRCRYAEVAFDLIDTRRNLRRVGDIARIASASRKLMLHSSKALRVACQHGDPVADPGKSAG